jgi:hypothetical protein
MVLAHHFVYADPLDRDRPSGQVIVLQGLPDGWSSSTSTSFWRRSRQAIERADCQRS